MIKISVIKSKRSISNIEFLYNARNLEIYSIKKCTNFPKRYTFYIDCFKTIAYNKVIKGYQDENLYDISEVQAILDWVNEQDRNKIYPDFGEDCLIDSMQSTTESPDLHSVEDTTTSPIAVYRISIQIDYIDNTEKLWK